ncbi:MAG: hypothetical protein AB1489_33580, partial [Acidobacteriota bacterium]
METQSHSTFSHRLEYLGKGYALSQIFPQQTFMEVRNIAIAITDGPRLRRWEEVAGEIALRHVIPGEPIQTKFIAGLALKWLGLPPTYESLRAELENFELATVLLLNVAIGTLLDRPQATVTIDELIRLIGWKPRSRVERDKMRCKVWRWLLLFDSMLVMGRRPGRYKHNEKVIDLTSADPLITIVEESFTEQQTKLCGSEIPQAVTWAAGPWLARWLGDERILQYFGNISNIAGIPSGKPSGAWA